MVATPGRSPGRCGGEPAIYVALAVTTEGRREILGLWASDGGEDAKHWMHILTEIKNRGVGDALVLVCDGLKGLPEAVKTVWPRTIVQTCIIHLLRNSFRYAARQTPQALNVSSGGGASCRKGRVFVEQRVVLEAVVELAEHAVEEVALGGGMPVAVGVAAAPVVGLGAG